MTLKTIKILRCAAAVSLWAITACSSSDPKAVDGGSDSRRDSMQTSRGDSGQTSDAPTDTKASDLGSCVPSLTLEPEKDWRPEHARFASADTIYYSANKSISSTESIYRLYADHICGGQRRVITDLVDRRFFAIDKGGYPVFFRAGPPEPSGLVRYRDGKVSAVGPNCSRLNADAMDIVGDRMVLNYHATTRSTRVLDLTSSDCGGWADFGDGTMLHWPARLSPDGKTILGASLPTNDCDPANNDFSLYSIDDKSTSKVPFAPVGEPQPECAQSGPFAFFPDGRRVLIQMKSSRLLVLDLDTKTNRKLDVSIPYSKWQPAYDDSIFGLEVSGDGKVGLILDRGGIRVFSLVETQ